MADKKKNGWIKFVPSLALPKERVSIAYDTHDERGVRYAYGYFQFHNGTCSCFWKDGNEQPKVVKVEDIRCWMPVPPLEAQEEPISEDVEEAAKHYLYSNILYDDVYVGNPTEKDCIEMFKAGALWQKEQMMKEAKESEVIITSKGILLSDLRIEDFDYEDKVKVIIIKEEEI